MGNYNNLRRHYCFTYYSTKTKFKMMTRDEIINRLEINHKLFVDFMQLLSEKDFMYAPAGK